ncbi:MAG: Flagellar fliL protein [Candidatus Magnetoglobus multicellularis str. Araruama]|uniref:Flagellar protein FliL n=1 Tax=Candidatus Magnetoglobus multicellularis str. Araruama TaxID=890399 RepID=A0A1V1PDZ9_9BACT|nr:MAG: Flagellar fliL protein [Candidatus Magnetoglobus multicellularis str. Araruama]
MTIQMSSLTIRDRHHFLIGVIRLCVITILTVNALWTMDHLFMSSNTVALAADEEEAPAEGEGGEAAPEQPEVLDVFLKLDPFIVNLKGNGMKRYLKTTIAIEVEVKEVKQELEMLTPKLRDTILFVLTSKSYNDLFSNEGKIALKHELIAHINRILKSGTIKAIYITDFIIQ